jgi:hypothetical protein
MKRGTSRGVLSSGRHFGLHIVLVHLVNSPRYQMFALSGKKHTLKRGLAILHRFRIRAQCTARNHDHQVMSEDSVASYVARLEARFKARKACHESARRNQ